MNSSLNECFFFVSKIFFSFFSLKKNNYVEKKRDSFFNSAKNNIMNQLE